MREKFTARETMRNDAMAENLRQKTTAKISYPRTFYVEIFHTSGTPGGQVRESETMHLLTENATVGHR